jgi:hypothetical protein
VGNFALRSEGAACANAAFFSSLLAFRSAMRSILSLELAGLSLVVAGCAKYHAAAPAAVSTAKPTPVASKGHPLEGAGCFWLLSAMI